MLDYCVDKLALAARAQSGKAVDYEDIEDDERVSLEAKHFVPLQDDDAQST